MDNDYKYSKRKLRSDWADYKFKGHCARGWVRQLKKTVRRQSRAIVKRLSRRQYDSEGI